VVVAKYFSNSKTVISPKCVNISVPNVAHLFGKMNFANDHMLN